MILVYPKKVKPNDFLYKLIAYPFSHNSFDRLSLTKLKISVSISVARLTQNYHLL